MRLFGVALLPERAVAERLVDFQRRHRNRISGPILGIERNLPHVSILQCPFEKNSLTQLRLAQIYNAWRRWVDEVPPTARFTQAFYQPEGWLFAGANLMDWGAKLQEESLRIMAPHINSAAITSKEPYRGYSKLERESYVKYGYRYVGQAFLPHVTLGRVNRESFPGLKPNLRSEFAKEFQGEEFRFGEIVFYEAGDFGSLASVIRRQHVSPS